MVVTPGGPARRSFVKIRSLRLTEVTHPDYAEQYTDWEMLADLDAGERVVKEHGARYMIPTELERNDPGNADTTKPSRFQQRIQRSVYINGVKRLTRYAMGNLFMEDVKLPDTSTLPEYMESIYEDADLLGSDMRRFIRNVSDKAYVMGHYFVIIDMPNLDEIQSLQDQKEANARPYLVAVDPRDIINWSIRRGIDGRFYLDWVVHRIAEYVSPGPYDIHEESVYYKVWYRDRWEVRKLSAENAPYEVVEEGVNPLGEVPIVPIYSDQVRPMVSQPPLLEPANLSLSHYNMYSMYMNGLMYHLNPLLVIQGAKDTEVNRGADYALFLPTNGDAKYVEYNGTSLSIAQKSADALAEEIMEAGLRNTTFLGANTSAEARRVSRADYHSFLKSVALSYENGWSKVFRLIGRWMGDSFTEAQSKVSFHKDYDLSQFEAGQLDFLLKARATGEISRKRFFEELRRGQVVNKDIDVDTEIREAQIDGPAYDVRAELKRMDLEAKGVSSDGSSDGPGNDNEGSVGSRG